MQKRLTPDERRARELQVAVNGLGKSSASPTRYQIPNYQTTPEVTQADLMRLRREIVEQLTPKTSEVTPEFAKAVIAAMRGLPETDKLEVQDIRNHQSFLFNKTKYGTHELMHGGSAAATSGLNSETPTGAVNDVNVTFVAAHTPVYITVNGGQYTVGTGMFLSLVGLTITLTAPVGTSGFITSFFNS